MRKKNWKLLVALISLMVFVLSGCATLGNERNELSGEITGNTYTASFYANNGEKFMTVSGQKIKLSPNIVHEYTYTDDGWEDTETLSSVVSITIDGNEIESCGSTIIFAESGLTEDVNFTSVDVINSSAKDLGDNTMIAGIVNKYKNMFGKSRVVVIQSQLGDPICAYSGDNVYWEVSQNLPKTTKLMVDGKALYIHRANFQIIDKELLD